MPGQNSYDTVIVGAGAAGCVLANRLSADVTRSVLLIEAGPDHGADAQAWPVEMRDPLSVAVDSHSWGYRQPRVSGDDTINLARARVVGGTTTVNGCLWIRGSAADYDRWASRGSSGWGFADLLPYFRRAESDPIGGPLHGTDGPVPIYRSPVESLTAVDRAFVSAAQARGFPLIADFNARPEQSPGVGPMPKNLADGVRMNGAFTYLAPARSRPNLTIAANCLVDRIEFDGRRAVAVTTASGDSIAAGEIVLCAGAYGSPAILLRSGVGPAAELERLDVPLIADLAGVGEHLLDHPLVSLDLPKPAAIQPDFTPGRRSFMPVGVKARSRQTDEEIDLHLYAGQDYDAERAVWFFWVSISLQNGLSRGKVSLTSRDPEATLTIDHRYFDAPEDLETLADGVELALTLLGTEPLASVLATDAGFAPLWRDREGLRAWLRGRVGTTFHPSSTCRMGPAADPLAVVDVAGNVHGVSGLRVVDASIFPDVVRANPHFTIVAAAEKIAECMR